MYGCAQLTFYPMSKTKPTSRSMKLNILECGLMCFDHGSKKPLELPTHFQKDFSEPKENQFVLPVYVKHLLDGTRLQVHVGPVSHSVRISSVITNLKHEVKLENGFMCRMLSHLKKNVLNKYTTSYQKSPEKSTTTLKAPLWSSIDLFFKEFQVVF